MKFLSFDEAMENNWKQQMASVVKCIELRVADLLSQGREPQVIICTQQTIGEIINYSAGPDYEASIDWREPQHLNVGDGGAVQLRILRTFDLKRGQVIIE